MSTKNNLPSVTTKAESRSTSNGMGNGLFAVQDIKVGEDVLHAKVPYIIVLDSSRLGDTCAGCFGKRQLDTGAAELRSCTRCRVVKYCDRMCQSRDWKLGHGIECPIYEKLQPMVLPNIARALLRMIARIGREKYDTPEFQMFFKLFSNLETHMAEVSQSQAHTSRITYTANAVKEYSGSNLTTEEIEAHTARLDLNSFNLTTSVYDRIGLYLHPYVALCNHSCDYNATVGFDGKELYMKAIKPIKKDEQIFISYIDTTTPREVRRKELSERFFFDCQCAKCERGTDTLEDRFNNPPEDISILETAEREALELMQSASASSTRPEETIRSLQSAIHILRKTSAWPITRQPYASLRDQLIVSLLSTGNFSTAFIHAAIRYLRIDPVIYSPAHPIRHVHAWVLAKLGIYLSQDQTEIKDPQLREVGLNFHYIIWYVLADLASRQLESCTVPSFKKLVGSNFAQVHKEFTSMGIDPSTQKAVMSGEWKKLEKLVHLALEKE
ncbi:Zinc finger MYND-type [Penicillium taxi]|uniref:Zinc finger MYND-type n=1 Tax=Penicillium taxi TaxID=168475 RepID=UPI00254587C9|nr:Zinc finger MYND-type [Penicillium taxi]KAJ5907500.1 Zinc finger MYND-type [Penicillium taxi]